MHCEPCGKNIVYHPSAACSRCYRDMQQQNTFLLQQLEAAMQAIVRLEAERAQEGGGSE